MATLPRSPPSLGNMPEEILCHIVSSILPLKWYSLATLVSLSRTNSYLRRWLMEDDSLWHLALLGRGMGRPLHTIPGYREVESAQGSGEDGFDGGVQAIAAMNGGTQLQMLSLNHLIQAQVQARIARDEEDRARDSSLRHSNNKNRTSHPSDSVPTPNQTATSWTSSSRRLNTSYRDLALQIYLHESECLHCKVGDSKLSHFYMTDLEMSASAQRMGINSSILNIMGELPGGSGWGKRKVCKGHFERVVTPDEASKLAVRTVKFFSGYEFFGYCSVTLPTRVANKSEPLTTPPLARIEVLVFIPCRLAYVYSAPTTYPMEQKYPEVMLISSFVVENWGGVTLGDWQYGFEKWINQPLTEQESTNFEARGIHGVNKGKTNTRALLIPPSYTSRFRVDNKSYDAADVRPLGCRVEAGRAVILLGDRQTPA